MVTWDVLMVIVINCYSLPRRVLDTWDVRYCRDFHDDCGPYAVLHCETPEVSARWNPCGPGKLHYSSKRVFLPYGMPSCFIRCLSVFGFKPSIAAHPSDPLILPLVVLSALLMWDTIT
jgi:hypothetical protein